MIRLLLLPALILPAFASWDAVMRLQPEQKVEVTLPRTAPVRGQFVSASQDTLVIRDRSGERSLARTDVRRVAIPDPSRRASRGLIATAIGAAAGFGIGYAVCPQCSNEGNAGKYVGPGIGIGAGVGAVAGFLPVPYRTIFRQ